MEAKVKSMDDSPVNWFVDNLQVYLDLMSGLLAGATLLALAKSTLFLLYVDFVILFYFSGPSL